MQVGCILLTDRFSSLSGSFLIGRRRNLLRGAGVESVEDRVRRVIATTSRKPLESVGAESTFEELGLDSLDRLNILFELEGEFDVQIDDEEAKQVTSVPGMVAGVEHLMANKAKQESSQTD
jgi:acyl carrier protein